MKEAEEDEETDSFDLSDIKIKVSDPEKVGMCLSVKHFHLKPEVCSVCYLLVLKNGKCHKKVSQMKMSEVWYIYI